MSKIKAGDEVIVVTGADKGKRGKVTRMLSCEDRLVIEGIKVAKKHVRPNPNINERGGIVERETPVHISNVAIVNPVTNKADKIAFKILENGDKVRIFKSNKELVDI